MDEVNQIRAAGVAPVVLAVNLDDDDVGMIIIDDDNDEDCLQLSIDSPRLSKLRLLLVLTLQKLPSRMQKHIPDAKIRQGLEITVQLLILVAICAQYLYILGVFHDKTLVEEEMTLTLTSFKNVVWNLRHPLYSILGLFYFRSTHLDELLRSLRLTPRSLKKAKRCIAVSCFLVIVFSVLVPGGIRLEEMSVTPNGDKKKGFSLSRAIANTLFLTFARIFALPVVLIFIVVFAFLYYEIRQYKKHIQSWPEGEHSAARNFFVDIKVQIKKAERAFQPFLIVHLCILLLVFIPGVLGLFERLRSEGSYMHSFQTTSLRNLFDNDFVKQLIRLPNTTIGGKNSLTATKLGPTILIIKMPYSATMAKTANNGVEDHSEKMQDKKAQLRIALEALAFLAEMLSLYIPITLLGKINKALLRVSEVIQCLKFEEQQRRHFLIQSQPDVDKMLKDLMSAQGVHILGMQLTVIKTLFLGAFMPLFTLLVHIMIRHVDLKT